jgi:hypothetical protein
VHKNVDVGSATGVPPGEVGGELRDALGISVLQAAVGRAEDVVSIRGADAVPANGYAAVDTSGVGI